MIRTSLALALVSIACQPAAAPVPSNQVVAPAVPAATADVLGFLPLASDIVLRFDVKALRGSPLWAEYQPKLVAAIGPELAGIKQKCGFDPLEAVESVTAGLTNTSKGGPPDGVFVVRGLDRDRTIACLEAQILPDTTVTNDHGVLSLAHERGSLNLMTFVDPSTLVLMGSTHSTREGLEAVLHGGAPLRNSPAFLETYGKLEPDATVWLAFNGNAAVLDKFAAMGGRPRGVYGTIRIAAGIAVRFHLRMETADQAAQIAATFSSQMQAARSMFDQLAATSEGDVVAITVDLSAAKLRSLVGMMAPMLNAPGASPPSGGSAPPSP